jgi:23S rRNA pseudouridine1911/1915/1917 synthase
LAEIEWEGTVGGDAAGQRLDQFLAEPLGSRARAARLIAAGLVRLDGRTVQKRRLVNAGEQVVVTAEALGQMPGFDPTHPASAEFTVAYEDDGLIVVDKPAGVVVHPARGHEDGTRGPRRRR